ncbi:MAG TPA: hypothetical protein VGH10_08250 [Actinomycetota bacterium]
MERWCARCEWLGESPAGPCPRCGAALLTIDPPEAGPAVEVDPPVAFEGGQATGAVPESVDPEPSAEDERAVEPEVDAAPLLVATGRPGRGASALAMARRFPVLTWLVLPAVVASAIGLTAIHRHDRATPGSGAAPARSVPRLPPVLLFVTNGIQGGPGSVLFRARGDGGEAQPVEDARFVGDFAVSPDGSQTAVVDLGGHLNIEPGDVTYPGRVEGMAFSPDGRTLAVCTASLPPQIVLLASGGGGRFSPLYVGPGCDPRWSVTGRWLAYRIPAGASGAFFGGRVGVFDTQSDHRRILAGQWPPAWAPAGWDGAGSLTVAMSRGIEALDPVSGARSLLVPVQRLSAFTSDRHPGPITMLQWSPDGRWLAVGLGRGANQDGAVFVIDPRTTQASSVLFSHSPTAAGATTPTSLAWSSTDRLLIGFDGAGGGGFSQVMDPSGVSARLALTAASWSPDGRWVLGRAPAGWLAVDPDDASADVAVGPLATWVQARWCCPPTSTVPAG